MTIIDDIIMGEHDLCLSDIIRAAQERKKALEAIALHTLRQDLSPGDRVRVSGLSPKYCNGRTAVVEQINRTRVVVRPEQPYKRFSGIVTVPLSCVERV